MNTLRISVDVALFILIWLVQIIIYPSFRYTDPTQFDFWHSRYMGLITYFVGPLMLAQVAIIGWQIFDGGNWSHWLAAVMVAGVWISTAALSVPCHTQLLNIGFDLPTIERLIQTNWYRTVLWTLVLALAFFSR